MNNQFSKEPPEGEIIVLGLLERPSLGSRIHTVTMKDGKPFLVAGHFYFDMPAVIAYAVMPVIPEEFE